MSINECYVKLKNIGLDIPIIDQSKRLFSKNSVKAFTESLVGSNKTIIDKKVYSKILSNINIEIKNGDSFGLLGHNGSGKTTLLRIISGIYLPSYGKIDTSGSISSILAIGTLLNPEATGYQNVEIMQHYFKKYNINKEDLIRKVEENSDLGEFLNLPVKLYSAGMQARLTFAVTTCLESDIMLVDEGISAGDEQFKEKANKIINDYYRNSKIKIFASHDLSFIKSNCNKIFLLKRGEGKQYDNVEEGIDYYLSNDYNSIE